LPPVEGSSSIAEAHQSPRWWGTISWEIRAAPGDRHRRRALRGECSGSGYFGCCRFTYLVTPKSGIRIDGRTHFYKNPTTNLVDVTPALAAESTGQPFPLVTSGSLQFFTTAPLNGPPVAGATTFTGSGVQAHLAFSVGFFRRF